MSVLDIGYICRDCSKSSDEKNKSMACEHCGGTLRGVAPGITGTRDSFGIKKSFKDESTGKTIDNWKSWERAGFRDAMTTVKDSNVKAGIKRKMDRIKHDKQRS